MRANRFDLPDLGLGLGLRGKHVGDLLAGRPPVFLELLTENHLDVGGLASERLERVAAAFPLVLHGVSLSIGSTDPLDLSYLRAVDALAQRTRAHWVSDHLCWTGVRGLNTHDLLPLPRTEAVLRHVVGRVRRVQDVLGRPLVLENPSSYVDFRDSRIPEAEFVARVAEEADCALLVDVNNVYVSARNHGFNAEAWIDAIPADRVVQVHVAGHVDKGTHLLDTHSRPVPEAVWSLYARLVRRTGPVSTLLEWDADIPDLATCLAEVGKAAGHREGLAHAA